VLRTLVRTFAHKFMKMKLVTAEWCGPCSMLKNMLDVKGLEVEMVDVDESPEFIKEHDIKSVPTLVLEDSRGVSIVKGTDDIISIIKENS
jgi:glutaredoxin